MAARCETCDHKLERVDDELVCLSCSHDKLMALQRRLAQAGIEFRGGDGKTLPPMNQAWDHGRPVLHLGPPDASLCQDSEYWVTQLHTWHQNGTFARMNASMAAKQPVQVRRSDGSLCVGVITATSGFGGRSIEVEIDTPDGPRFKSMNTEDFLELNPGFGPHLKELVPEQRAAGG